MRNIIINDFDMSLYEIWCVEKMVGEADDDDVKKKIMKVWVD